MPDPGLDERLSDLLDQEHDPEPLEGCWGDRNGRECGEPPTNLGLCGDCLTRLAGERPAMLIPSPPSETFLTGAGRR